MPWLLLSLPHFAAGELFGNGGDKLGIGRPVFRAVYVGTEKSSKGMEVASVPSNLDSMPYGAFHTGGRGGIDFRHGGI